MNPYPNIFNILATHLEMDDRSRGRYQNKFLPPEKVEAIYKDISALVEKEIAEAKNNGKKEMLTGFMELFSSITEDLKKTTKMRDVEPREIRKLWDMFGEKT